MIKKILITIWAVFGNNLFFLLGSLSIAIAWFQQMDENEFRRKSDLILQGYGTAVNFHNQFLHNREQVKILQLFDIKNMSDSIKDMIEVQTVTHIANGATNLADAIIHLRRTYNDGNLDNFTTTRMEAFKDSVDKKSRMLPYTHKNIKIYDSTKSGFQNYLRDSLLLYALTYQQNIRKVVKLISENLNKETESSKNYYNFYIAGIFLITAHRAIKKFKDYYSNKFCSSRNAENQNNLQVHSQKKNPNSEKYTKPGTQTYESS